MNSIVNIQNAIKDYPLGKTTVRALHGVTLQITKGEFTAIAGPSGSGKTTLLNLIGCVDTPTEGLVEVANQNVAQLSEAERTKLRLENLGFIFQSFNLIPVLTVFQKSISACSASVVERRERRNHLRESWLPIAKRPMNFRRTATARRHRACTCNTSGLGMGRRSDCNFRL